MLKSLLHPRIQTGITTAIFLFFLVWWLALFLTGQTESTSNLAFGTIYGLYPFLGVAFGLSAIGLWGGYKSLMGKMIIALTLGMFGQAFGQSSFSFMYLVLGIEVPYPSIPDIGYFGSTVFYIIAGLWLAKAAGAHFSLRKLPAQVQAVLIPVVTLAASYYYLLNGYVIDMSMPWLVFFDFAYPLSDAVAASLVIVTFTTTQKFLGGKMKGDILLIMLAFAVTYVANYAYIVFAASYYPGSFIDLIYLISYFFMSLAFVQLRKTALQLQGKM